MSVTCDVCGKTYKRNGRWHWKHRRDNKHWSESYPEPWGSAVMVITAAPSGDYDGWKEAAIAGGK